MTFRFGQQRRNLQQWADAHSSNYATANLKQSVDDVNLFP